MFKGNEKLRGLGELIKMDQVQIQEYFKCSQDKIHWCENYFHIISLDHGDILFKPHDYQKKAIICIDHNPDNLLNTIMMFPRQAGKTTLVSAYLLHEALFKDHQTIAIVANKYDTALEIMGRIRYACENLPLWMQSGVKEFNKGSIEFENGSKIICSVTTSTAISGKSINILYIDEMSKIPKNVANEFISSTFPVIASGKTTKIIITSTPKGLNSFYDFWKGAVNKKNDFYPMKIHWWDVPGRDEAWKEREIRKFGKQKFAQEYSCVNKNTIITVMDKKTGEIKDIKIEDLYNELKV